MLKKNMSITLFVFVFLTLKQLIFDRNISWVDNIGISVCFFLIYVFWDWAKKPYDWSKHKKKDNTGFVE